MRHLRPILVIMLILLTAGLAHGQVATVLMVDEQPLPNAPDYTVGSISTPDVNGPDGWAFTVTASAPGGLTVSLAYGTLLGGEPGLLRTESATDVYVQDSWESFFGMADADVCYSASCTRIADGESGLDSVWFGDSLVAIEEEPFPYRDGWFWRFGSRPGVTRDGIPYFVGGITDTQGGSTQERGLFYGPDGEPLIIGGVEIDGLPDPVAVSTANVGFDYRFSAYGTNWIAEVQTETGDFNTDNHIVITGAVATAGGMPLSEGGMVPESIGGLPGESYDNWDYLGVTENGDWMVTGDTDADSSTDEFVMINGEIVLREGDMIDGMMLTSTVERGFMGEDGDWAVCWDVETAEGDKEVLILNGEIMLMEGMGVDLDGDGEIDEDTAITDFAGSAALAVADRGAGGSLNILFTADVEYPGAVRQDEVEIIRADPEAGHDEDWYEDLGTRVEAEMGLVLTIEGSVSIEDPGAPGDAPDARLALAQNQPNPFNPTTRIVFSLGSAEPVKLAVYDMHGRLVRTLVDETRTAGEHAVIWDGSDGRGQRVASGTYLYRLETGDRVLTRTMVMVK
ncbi:T9SS type A sorting domain-containing protein [bacterium]|nr:T9SS type A sorting domain-containing protein [bacterium]